MKNKLIYLFITCMAIWISSTGFILAQHNLTQAQLKEDFSLLKSALQEAHPVCTGTIPKISLTAFSQILQVC